MTSRGMQEDAYRSSEQCERGYILAFSIILIGTILALATASSRSVLTDLSLAENTLASAKAVAASEAGIECALLYIDAPSGPDTATDGTLRTTALEETVSCPALGAMGSVIPNTFPGGHPSPDGGSPPRCIPGGGSEYTYPDFQIEFENGSCAIVSVQVLQGFFDDLCDFSIVSLGRDNCSDPAVERGRTETVSS